MSGENNKIYSSLQIIDDLINEGKFQDANNDLISLDSQYPQNKTIQFAKVGLLIDIGFGLKKQRIIKHGLKIGKILIKNESYKNFSPIISFNMANGFYSLFVLQSENNSENHQIKIIPYDNQNLQNSKKYFRDAISSINELDFQTKLKTLTNYANCLDTLNRGIEAMNAYDKCLDLKPNFPMALGNKAMQLMNFSKISGEYQAAIFITAYQMLIKAIGQNSLIQYGGCLAKQTFKSIMDNIERQFKDKSVLSKPIVHKTLDLSDLSKFERSYLEFCMKEKLFLNLHIHETRCEAALNDSIFISLLVTPNEKENAGNLINFINQLKEDYAIARMALFLAKNKNESFNNISLRTQYGNTDDYVGFNLYLGFVKNSFKLSFDILDKIANFINLYLEIGLVESNIKFYATTDRGCIWRKNGLIRENYKNMGNKSILALYDIFLDFISQEYLEYIQIRNAITHRKLLVCHSNFENLQFDANNCKIGYETLENKTKELLQIIRAAIIYLINFVEEEERKKRDNHNCILPVYFDSDQFLPE